MILAEAEAKCSDGVIAVNDFLFDALGDWAGQSRLSKGNGGILAIGSL